MTPCEEIRKEYEELKNLKREFDVEFEKAVKEGGDLMRAKELREKLKQKRDALEEKLWTSENMSQKELREQYNLQLELCHERGILETFSSGQEGIKDSEGNEYPMPALKEVMAKLKSNDLYKEKIAVFENPFILITPFALSPEAMKDKFSEQIEEHFVEERTEVDRRIPDKNKTRLFGVDGKPLELRTDRENVYFSDLLKNLKYFPEWKKEGGSIKPSGGISKKEVITQVGGWTIGIIEGIPVAPKKGEEKEIEKDIRIRGQSKKVKRKQVEGGLDASEQYEFLKRQNEEGFTLQDWIFYAMLYLKKNNIVLDDDRRTHYNCRLLGVNGDTGNVAYARWNRDNRQAYIICSVFERSYLHAGARAAVRVKLRT